MVVSVSAFMVDTVVERSTRSMLDPLEPVVRRLLEEWAEIKAPRVTEILRADYGYEGSVDLVKEAPGADAAKQGPAGAEDEPVALPLGLVLRPSVTPATASDAEVAPAPDQIRGKPTNHRRGAERRID